MRKLSRRFFYLSFVTVTCSVCFCRVGQYFMNLRSLRVFPLSWMLFLLTVMT